MFRNQRAWASQNWICKQSSVQHSHLHFSIDHPRAVRMMMFASYQSRPLPSLSASCRNRCMRALPSLKQFAQRTLAASGKGFGEVAKAPKKAAKKKKQPRKQAAAADSDRDQEEQFDKMMNCWHDVFSASCEEPERAAELFELARKGEARHGRGCVSVTGELVSSAMVRHADSKLAARASDSKALSTNEDLIELSWRAAWFPAALVKELGTGYSESGMAPAADAFTAPSEPIDDYHGDESVRTEVQRAMRGIDNTQLMSLVGLLPPDEQVAEPYDPEQNQFALQVTTTLDGQRMAGADVVEMVLNDDGSIRLISPNVPDGWDED